MVLSIVCEERFIVGDDGKIYSEGSGDYTFWSSYLQVFDAVRVVARIRRQEGTPLGEWRQADGPGVAFAPLPYYLGPAQYLLKRRDVLSATMAGLGEEHAVLFRVPSPIGAAAACALRRTGRPYGVEVVGDPWGALAPGAVEHPLRAPIRIMMQRQLKRTCASAAAAAYVTESTLQARYPAPPDAFQTSYSSIKIGPEGYVDRVRDVERESRLRLVGVGSLEQMYKGPDLFIRSLARVREHGVDAEGVWLGDGRHLEELKELVAQYDLEGLFTFLGRVPAGEAVRDELDRSDVFVMPSRTEGLPRAMIEAMARGLPCIGSRVGGIPELLPEEDLVPTEDPRALAAKIIEFASDRSAMKTRSVRNLQRSRDYALAVLDARRTAMYRAIKERTQSWLVSRDG